MLRVAIEVVVLLIGVSLHESAHGWVAFRCGDRTAHDLGRISLNPIRHLDPFGSVLLPILLAVSGAPVFGWAKPVPVSLRGVPHPRRANLLVAAAGPLSNLLLAAVAALALRYGPLPVWFGAHVDGLSRVVILLAISAVVVNASLAVFNLLPIPPLDGFGVLESLLPARLRPLTLWLRRYGMIIFLLAIMTGALRNLMVPIQRTVVLWLLGAHR